MSSKVSVQLVKTQAEMRKVYQLTHDTFVEKKLIHEQKDRLLINNRDLDFHKNTQVFIARIGEEIRGTISITVHQKMTELYNYSFFSHLLDNHYNHDSPSFSGWRLATKGNTLERYLLTINLILYGNNVALDLGIPQAYFSFIPRQLKVYKTLFPTGEILGTIRKKTEVVNSELVLMKYHPNAEGREHLTYLKNKLIKRFPKKLG